MHFIKMPYKMYGSKTTQRCIKQLYFNYTSTDIQMAVQYSDSFYP